jgi:hypothetical protein
MPNFPRPLAARKLLATAFFVLVGAALTAHFAPAQGKRAQPEAVMVPRVAPRVEDVSTMDGIIKTYYDVISGPAGQPRQWSRDRTLYIPEVRFVAMRVDKQQHPLADIMSHQQFVERSNPGLVRSGFYEAEIHRVTHRFGNLAHVFSTYESRNTKDGPVIQRGINSIELFWDGKRWWIASAIWDDERKDNPIPAEFLP